jgi:predicted kinase
VLRTDEVRKELAVAATPPGDIYTPEWNERTYEECWRRARALLFEGRRVLVDANFRAERWRQSFLEDARAWGVPAALLHCRAEPEVVRARLLRRRDGPSDADWSVYLQLASRWEEFGPRTRPLVHEVPTGGAPEDALSRALQVLRHLHLA